jgi:lipoprotein Spr
MNPKHFVIFLFLFLFLSPFLSKSQDCSPLQSTKAYKWFEQNGICMDSSQRPYLYFSTYEWAGTRYSYGKAVKQKGTDCSGFVSSVFRDVYCVELSRSSVGIWPQTIPIDKKDLQEGDILFFKIRKGRISHVGIYLGNNKFIHAAVKGGVIVSDLGEPYYARYFFSGGRVVQKQ